MKNREVRVFIASMMLVSLAVGSLSGAPLNVQEKGKSTVTAVEYAGAQNKESAKTVSESKSALKPKKEETVYAKIDGNGSVKSITVSDQLKNISDSSKLEDISDLQDIVNVKGEEAFSAMGKSIVWDTADTDICYQGTTSKELPVGIKISYKLDGKDISAADLKGKGGRVSIRYTYENKSGNKGKAATPFMMATGLLLDEDTFKNVTVENGRLISDGERNMVIGYGLPAMKNILGIEEKDLDIPDYFEIEADVTEYEPVEGMTIATNSIFNDLDTDRFDSLDELKDSMNELQDASSQLVRGSGELKNGIDTLLASSGTLTDGIDRLANGGGELQTGTNELENGGKALADGNARLADGTGMLLDGTRTLADGAGELNSGLQTAAEKTQNVLIPGIKALDAGVTQMQGELNKQLPELREGIKKLDDGANALQGGMKSLNDGAAELEAGATNLKGGIDGLNNSMDQLTAAAQGLQQIVSATSPISAGNTQDISIAAVQNAENISAQAEALEGQLYAIQQNASAAASEMPVSDGTGAAQDYLNSLQYVLGSIVTDDPEVLAALTEAQGLAGNAAYALGSGGAGGQSAAAGQAAEQAAAAIGTVQAISANADAVADHVAQISSQADDSARASQANAKDLADQLAAGLAAAKGGTDSLAQGADSLAQGAGQLKKGADSLQSGISELAGGTAALSAGVDGMAGKVNDGVSQLKSGTSQIVSGVDGSNGLASGLNQLAAGAKKINEGSTELSAKMREADEGAKSAASGAASLASGASQLNAGASVLKDGLDTLQSGSGTLINGVQQLDDGAAQLNDGMIRFDKDGIQKLTDAFGGDTEGLLDKVNEMLDASRAYKNFSGISDGMDGEVKFVFVTEATI